MGKFKDFFKLKEGTTDKESPFNKFLTGLYNEAAQFDKPFKENRKDNRKFYKGDQWRRKQPQWKSTSVNNFISPIIRNEVAILTGAVPNITVRPAEWNTDKDSNMANILNRILYNILYKQKFDGKYYRAVKNCSIDGISYFYPTWNETLSNGLGDVEIRVETADCVKMDPSGEGNYFVITKKYTLAEIDRYYPGYAQMVKADMDDSTEVNLDGDKRPNLPVQSTDGSETVTYEGTEMDVAEQHKKVDFEIFYIKDDSVAYLKDDDEKGQVKAKKGEEGAYPQKMFPNGRWVHRANKKIIVKDEPCRVKHFPIVPVILDPDPDTNTNGISVMDYIKDPQKDYNEMYALIKDYFRGTVYPRTTYDPRSGIKPNKVRNRWGAMYPAHPQQLSFWAPPSPPNNLFTLLGEQKGNMEHISTIQELLQGRRPSSITSAEGLRELKDSSRAIQRPKAMLLEESIGMLGELIIDYVQQGYTVPRVVRLIGLPKPVEQEIGPAPQIENPAPGTPDQSQMMQINYIRSIEGIEEMLHNPTVGDFDIYVEPNSSMPTTEGERFARLIELAQLGMPVEKELLENSGLREYGQILKELQNRQQQQAQMQQQQMQIEMQIEQAKLQIEAQKAQAEIQKAQVDSQSKSSIAQGKIAETQIKAQSEGQKMLHDRAESEIDLQMKEIDLAIKGLELRTAKVNASKPQPKNAP